MFTPPSYFPRLLLLDGTGSVRYVPSTAGFPFYQPAYFFEYTKNFNGYILPILGLLWVGQILALGGHIWKRPKYALAREQSLFLSPYYDPIFLDSFLLLNRHSTQASHFSTSRGSLGKKKRPTVFICSTVYREAEYEVLISSSRQIQLLLFWTFSLVMTRWVRFVQGHTQLDPAPSCGIRSLSMHLATGSRSPQSMSWDVSSGAPGCFSVFRASAIANVLETYQSSVTSASEFLTKDMGEDRWLCTLLIQKGWRLEYAVLAKTSTYCPDIFDELYNQRQRWIPSTLANLHQILRNAKSSVFNSTSVSFPFILYQLILIFRQSSFPAPSSS